MRKIASIFLAGIIAFLLFPWQAICFTHPFGHDHHYAPGELSPCEKQKLCEQTSFWPPMDCRHASLASGDYRAPQNHHFAPVPQSTAVAAPVLCMAEAGDYPQGPFLLPPEPQCNSGPPLSGRLLRAPPSA